PVRHVHRRRCGQIVIGQGPYRLRIFLFLFARAPGRLGHRWLGITWRLRPRGFGPTKQEQTRGRERNQEKMVLSYGHFGSLRAYTPRYAADTLRATKSLSFCSESITLERFERRPAAPGSFNSRSCRVATNPERQNAWLIL